MSRRPNLFILGAPKCGTTAWVSYLSRRPDIYFSPSKEPHYFNTDFPGFRWARSLPDYLALFEDAGEAKIVGEGSVMHLYSEAAAGGIAAFAPDAKVMIFLRDQRQFIPSYHQQLLYNMDEDETDLAVAWRASGAREANSVPRSCREPKFLDYKAVGRFSEQVERVLARFPAANVKIVLFDEFVRDPRAQYLDILAFLDLPDDGITDFPRINPAHDHRSRLIAGLTQRPPAAASRLSQLIRRLPGLGWLRPSRILRKLNRVDRYRSAPSPDVIREIGDYYREDNARLATLIGRRLVND